MACMNVSFGNVRDTPAYISTASPGCIISLAMVEKAGLVYKPVEGYELVSILGGKGTPILGIVDPFLVSIGAISISMKAFVFKGPKEHVVLGLGLFSHVSTSSFSSTCITLNLKNGSSVVAPLSAEEDGVASCMTYSVRFKPKYPLMMENDVVVCYADGCCLDNGKATAAAGCGVYWQQNNPLNARLPLPGLVQTNQRAEITAVIHAVKTAQQLDSQGAWPVSGALEIRTDSKYVVNAINEWIPMWIPKSWKSAKGTLVENKDLFEELWNAIQQFGHRVKLVHVRGHSNIEGNEIANSLAREGALEQRSKEDKENVAHADMLIINGFSFCRHGLERCHQCTVDYTMVNDYIIEDELEEAVEEGLYVGVRDSLNISYQIANNGQPACVKHSKVGCKECFDWARIILQSCC